MPTITPKYSSWSWSTSMTFKSRTTSTNKTNWPPRKCQELRKWYLKAKRKKTLAFWVRYFGGSQVKTLKIWSRCNRFFSGRNFLIGCLIDGGFSSDIQVQDSRINLLSDGFSWSSVYLSPTLTYLLLHWDRVLVPNPSFFCSWELSSIDLCFSGWCNQQVLHELFDTPPCFSRRNDGKTASVLTWIWMISFGLPWVENRHCCWSFNVGFSGCFELLMVARKPPPFLDGGIEAL